MRNIFIRELTIKAKIDPRIVLITGDLGYGVLDDFRQSCPSQFINSGIAEQSMISMAGGFSTLSLRPFVYSIANFPTFRALEQIRNDVSYMNHPVTIVSVGAGLAYGAHGYTHHAVEDLAIIHALPNIDIYSPNTEDEVIWSLEKILAAERPAYLRLGLLEPEFSGVISLKGPISTTDIHISDYDGVICWTGSMGKLAFEASEYLKSQGRNPLLISMPSLTSDYFSKLFEIIKDRPLLTLEEHTLKGGFGSMILEFASNIGRNFPIKRIGIPPETNSLIGSREYLLGVSRISSREIQGVYNSFFK